MQEDGDMVGFMVLVKGFNAFPRFLTKQLPHSSDFRCHPWPRLRFSSFSDSGREAVQQGEEGKGAVQQREA